MSLLDGAQARIAFPISLPRGISGQHLLLAALIFTAVFTRFWRLGSPEQCYFDEVYFPTTGAEILKGHNNAWDFFGHENTHPPLSKEFMALGQGLFGQVNNHGADNKCWGSDHSDRKTGADWQYSPFGWRFFGALAGVAGVIFMYLLAKNLFKSDVAGLAAGFFLTFEGLALTQSRIATPDAFVLCFMLGCVYFMVTNRFLLSGILFGAAVASKWNAALTILPIILFFIWKLLEKRRAPDEPERVDPLEVLMPAGLWLTYVAVAFNLWRIIGTRAEEDYSPLDGPPEILGVAMLLIGVAMFAVGAIYVITRTGALRGALRSMGSLTRVHLQAALVFGVFFIMVPGYTYLLTYLPMLLNGGSLADILELNQRAFDFHSHLDSPHPYQSPWDTWPITMRPIFFYLGPGLSKIYNLGNPMIFWMSLPALAFTLWQGLRSVRARLDQTTGEISIWGRIPSRQMALLFVVLGYLAFWLPWALNPRILFLYHYLPALSFAILALAYVMHWLWHCQSRYGRPAVVATMAVVAASFIYFYPHWAAVDVPQWLDNSYYWFDSWR